MKLIKQRHKLKINLSAKDKDENKNKKHGPLFPNNIRAAIVGPSGCGKTTLMVGLLKHPNGLKFQNLYVYCKTLFQEKYQMMKKVVNSIPGMLYEEYDNDAICLKDVNPNSIVIFDDVACEKQSPIRDFYCMGRHKNIDSFYLCQTYTRLLKGLLRDNLNFIILFKQDLVNLKHVYEEYVAGDMKYDQFLKMCRQCWEEPHGFLVISITDDINNGRYRNGLDAFYKMN